MNNINRKIICKLKGASALETVLRFSFSQCNVKQIFPPPPTPTCSRWISFPFLFPAFKRKISRAHRSYFLTPMRRSYISGKPLTSYPPIRSTNKSTFSSLSAFMRILLFPSIGGREVKNDFSFENASDRVFCTWLLRSHGKIVSIFYKCNFMILGEIRLLWKFVNFRIL